jgi:hypothetical protein
MRPAMDGRFHYNSRKANLNSAPSIIGQVILADNQPGHA